MLPGLASLSYEDRLKVLKLPTLRFRRLRGDLIEVYKILTGIYDTTVTKGLFTPMSYHHTRGHSLKIEKHHCRLDIRRNFFTQRIIDIWNVLPESTVRATSVNIFKNRIDSYLQDQPMKYNYNEPFNTTTRTGNTTNIFQESELNIEAKDCLRSE